jgi:hypothetical protein
MKFPTKPTEATTDARSEVVELTQRLAEPFEPTEVRFKPAVVTGNRALALAYVDARVIQDRLDDVLGVTGWQDDYECLPDGSVVCRLRLRMGEEWITKVDVGGPSEQPDGGDRMKAAFSDALKRAAVKFGVGRYLYRLPSQWIDYDAKRRQFLQTPTVPAWARPAEAKAGQVTPSVPQPPAPRKPAAKPAGKPAEQPPPAPRKPAAKPAGKPAEQPPPAPAPAPRRPAAKIAGHVMPTNGAELQRRLYDYDARLAAQGVCQQGDLVKHVVQAGVKAGYDSDLSTWSGKALTLAVDETKAFETRGRKRPEKEVA